MKGKTLFFSIFFSGLFYVNSSAQNKNAVHAEIFYPLSIGDHSFTLLKDILGVDLGYGFSIFKKISVGPEYSGSLHTNKILFTDASGNLTEKDLVSSFIHNLDILGSYKILLNDKCDLSVALSGGYSIVSTGFNNTTFGKFRSKQDGYNITPKIAINRKISEHFSLYVTAGYSFLHITQSSSPQLMSSFNQTAEIVNAGVGTEFAF